MGKFKGSKVKGLKGSRVGRLVSWKVGRKVEKWKGEKVKHCSKLAMQAADCVSLSPKGEKDQRVRVT